MHIGTLLLQIYAAMLAGYLGFASLVADTLSENLVRVGVLSSISVPPLIIDTVPSENEVAAYEPTPISITSDYELGGSIPKILLEQASSQSATLISTATTTDESGVSEIKNALVNIFCTLKTKKYSRATTGSGVFISDRGVILTNAHVAQFLLLDELNSDVKTSCVVRTGSPARTEYTAKLLYIPPLWVSANAKELQNDRPQGTGERDYALIYVTESTTAAPLPTSFPFIAPETKLLTDRTKEQELIVGGYPAEKLLIEGLRAELPQSIATTSIHDFYTYGGKQADLMSLAPSSVGEHGSSGGPVVSQNGALIGLVSTKGDTVRDGARSLRALTIAYIDRTIEEETNADLETTLESDLPARAKLFRESLGNILSWFITEEL